MPIVIDDAEFTLNNKAAALEKIRDISDRAEVTVVLIGMERIQQTIAGFKQISSRIARVVPFLPASLPDAQAACVQLGEVEMSPELVAEVHRLSGGRTRKVLNIIATIEQVVDCTESDAEKNLQRYVRALAKAGYLTESKREKGRWHLKRNTGRLAPALNNSARTLTDSNTGEVHDV